MNKTKIEWTDYSYIAGFFDGEGSAMVLTVHREKEKGVYRFRPVVKISQKTTPILNNIKKKLGFGSVFSARKNKPAVLQINGNKKVLKFVELISPFVILKKKQLILLKQLIALQNPMGKTKYSKQQIKQMVEIRDKVHRLNLKTRTNIKLKYSKEEVFKNYVFK